MSNTKTKHSKPSSSRKKPSKPYKDFPLFPHATRRWAKKIRGKLHYFGPWEDPQGALARYVEQKDDLHAGRISRVQSDGFTIRDLCNHFLTWKRSLRDSGEIATTTFDDYFRICEKLIKFLGKNRLVEDLGPSDFTILRNKFAKNRGLVALGNQITRARVVFNYAYNADFIDKPLKFGPSFKRPSRRSLRIARAKRPNRLYEPEQINLLIEKASTQMAAMIYLGINCGLGNADIARLEFRMLIRDTTWLDYPRQKTGIARSCPLWPETSKAIKTYLKERTEPTNEKHHDRVFITKYGESWFKETSDNPISNEFRKLADDTNVYRKGLTFYALRHTFETIGGESGDQIAVDHIMGHTRDDMASIYRQRINDGRLVKVTEFVRDWLQPGKPAD